MAFQETSGLNGAMKNKAHLWHQTGGNVVNKPHFVIIEPNLSLGACLCGQVWTGSTKRTQQSLVSASLSQPPGAVMAMSSQSVCVAAVRPRQNAGSSQPLLPDAPALLSSQTPFSCPQV